MNVLHVISSSGLYGAERVILQLFAAMPYEQRAESCLGVFAHQGQEIPALYRAAAEQGIPCELLPCRGQVDRKTVQALRDLARTRAIDVVHAHGFKADVYTYAAFRGAKQRPGLVSTCHTWYDNDLAVKIYGALDRWVLRNFDEVVAVSEEVLQRLVRAGVSEAKTRMIRNGIDTSPFGTGQSGADLTAQSAPLRVGLVGRLAPEKGVDLFIRAAASVLAKDAHVDFVIAGEGPERKELEQLIAELGVAGQVSLLGAQDDMSAFYRSLTVLVSASRQEGLPMALLEGMAGGLPLVATRVGEVPKVVAEGKTGWLVPPDDVPALAARIEDLLNDSAQREQFGQAGRRRIEEKYSAQRMVAEYAELYRDAVKRSSGQGPQKSQEGHKL